MASKKGSAMSLNGRYTEDLETGCWNWSGPTKGFGYGYLTVGSRKDGSRKTQTAHRYSYEINNGEIPKGAWVLHKCDNPKCVNPDHLYLGDRAQNIKDMISRGRRASDKGESNNNSKLTEMDVVMMRSERSSQKTSYRKLAAKYGLLSHKTAKQICDGILWPHVRKEPPK